MKILLVDDADVFRQSVANLLHTRGHEVIEAANGLEGVKLARAHLPDVVVSDIVMSQVDGYAMTSLLRQHPSTADIPLVLITGEADLKGMRKGMTLGADDYIAKPFKMDELVAALELRVLRRRALRDEVERKLACLGTSIGLKPPAELAQPLGQVLEAARALDMASQAPGQAALHQLVQPLFAAARRIERATGNLLVHAQLELFGTNPAHLNELRQTHTVEAEAVVAAQARRCAEAAERAGDLKLKAAPGSAAISEARLTKLVEELVGNAFQYSPPGAAVTVQCVDDGTNFLLTVTDQGRGMTLEQLAMAEQAAPGAGPDGGPRLTGLGLAIARRLAEVHGGKFLLNSEPGKGTTVRVTLPTKPLAASAPAEREP
jgi:DNA-binding response OmpR family regulator/anti-sigma regulatory factor (Ser/Thr protein kinase)